MLHAWNEGMASLRDAQRAERLKGLTEAISAAGLSDPEPPETTCRVIGRSELLATPHKPKTHKK